MGITLLLGGEELLADRAIADALAKRKNSVITNFDADILEVGAGFINSGANFFLLAMRFTASTGLSFLCSRHDRFK